MKARKTTWTLHTPCPACQQGSTLLLVACPGCAHLAAQCAEEGATFADVRVLVATAADTKCRGCGLYPVSGFALATDVQILAAGLTPADYS